MHQLNTLIKNLLFLSRLKVKRNFWKLLTKLFSTYPKTEVKAFFWWETAAPNKSFSTRTFFKNNGEAMPVLKVFDKDTRN